MKAENENYILRIERYDDAESPREWDNLGTMFCWHSRHVLGDKHNYYDHRAFLESFVRELLQVEQLAEPTSVSGLFKVEQRGNKYDVIDVSLKYTRCSTKNLTLARELALNYAAEELTEYATDAELLSIISEYAVILPLYLYDHSGITMSSSPFSCQWDSVQVGWIFCTKERFREETGYTEDELFNTDSSRHPAIGERIKTADSEWWGQVVSVYKDSYAVDFDWNKIPSARSSKNIKIVRNDEIIEVMSYQAAEILEEEVETYDKYLRGDIYGYELSEKIKCNCCGHVVLEYVDSCHGYYSIQDIKENLSSS
ncbi:hypothetical protein SAMN05446037_1006135 [Anaerovirgula multivorans]|uniref:Uncharacterized protein n=1 Tax=Anaerovirgula multivorans TaxID=312168 RepID=A0A239CTE4_9FIRM|nr:hypothetical protein [Anaerovirgula multivorans]SNS23209.1 hypothetical protein SAMN05446037_1006135 [Anaerovirgula multivorans]